MTYIKLSPLAEKLFDRLNSLSYIWSVESAALQLANDPFISQKRRTAYRELYEYLSNDLY
jgi:hypothetical protein